MDNLEDDQCKTRGQTDQMEQAKGGLAKLLEQSWTEAAMEFL